MATKPSASQQLASTYTEGATKAAQSRVTGLQSQIDALGEARDVSTAYNKDMHGDQSSFDQQRKMDLAYNQQLSEQRAGLQSQLSQQQAIVADPRSQMTDRQKDLISGVEFAEGVIGPDGLGKLQDDKAMQDIESRFQQLSQGMSSQEMQARREQALEGISGDAASRTRALQARLGGMGVKGAVAGQQAMNLQASAIKARGNLERDLLIQDSQMQREGVRDLAQFTQGVRQFDLGQEAKQMDLMTQSALGFGKMGVEERVSKFRAQKEAEARQYESYQENKGGCVVASHAVSVGAFNEDDRKRAVMWCIKNLHGTFIGETFRKGYRYIGRKLVKKMEKTGNYKYHQEFTDWVDFASGKKRNLKNGIIFVKRSIQMFVIGLFLSE